MLFPDAWSARCGGDEARPLRRTQLACIGYADDIIGIRVGSVLPNVHKLQAIGCDTSLDGVHTH